MNLQFLLAFLTAISFVFYFIPQIVHTNYRVNQNSSLQVFYGAECPHCDKMLPVVKRLNYTENIEIAKLEVWHNKKNFQKLYTLKNKFVEQCGGRMVVPAFYNQKAGRLLCGEQSYDTLKEWASK